MVIKKSQLLDVFIYCFFLIAMLVDFFKSADSSRSFVVYFLLLLTGLMSYIFYLLDKGFLTIDKVVYIFAFLFCYYAPFHQYVSGVNIHRYGAFSDTEYASASLVIILFLIIFKLVRKYDRNKKKSIFVKSDTGFSVRNFGLLTVSIVCILCLAYLYITHNLFNFTSEAGKSAESLMSVVLKIVRFFPVACLLLLIHCKKVDRIHCSKSVATLGWVIISISCAIVYFPINGTIGRFLLFGTYISILGSIFEEAKHKSYILLVTVVGFYFVFPAFNFFKYHGIGNLAGFMFGGFDVTTIDYDAFQMFMQSLRYVRSDGLLWGANIFSALMCIIPRSIWSGKLEHTGVIISKSINAAFNNVSCPIFAEFYVAFGIIGVIIGTYFFSKILGILEFGNRKENVFFKGLYYIALGIVFSYMRGAMLPTTSIWYSLNISFVLAYSICKMLR